MLSTINSTINYGKYDTCLLYRLSNRAKSNLYGIPIDVLTLALSRSRACKRKLGREGFLRFSRNCGATTVSIAARAVVFRLRLAADEQLGL